jgi:hypothetical protein
MESFLDDLYATKLIWEERRSWFGLFPRVNRFRVNNYYTAVRKVGFIG